MIAGVPALTASVGRAYAFTPSASDADGDSLSFSVQNLPTWATLNPATGKLSGTPTQTGQSANIIISVSDGKATTKLPAFAVNVAPMILGSATVRWSAPSTNTDGSALQNLAGFRVLYGTDPNQLTQKLELPGASLRSVQIEELKPGTYYFAVKAYNTTAKESTAAPVVWKTIL